MNQRGKRLKNDLETPGKLIVRGIALTLLTVGAIIFIFGDKALRMFYSVNLTSAEFESMGIGAALMILGALLKMAIGDKLGKQNK
jgi:hypothetical protein